MEAQYRHLSSMGTRLDMVFPGMNPDMCNGLTTQINNELLRLDALLSIHRTDSELSLLNRTGHAGSMEISEELYEILGFVKAMSEKTKGYFDVTLKPVSDSLRTEADFEQLADQQLADQHLRDLTGMDNLILEQGSVCFSRKGVELDLGGFGKGYAVKQIIEILRGAGIDCALISFGESLVYGLGNHPFGETWKISVPGDQSEQPLEFDLKDEALSTSGNSLNNRKKFANSGHIVNPITLRLVPMDGLVSVKAKDPVEAEVYSTALFSAGPDISKEILERVSGVSYSWVHPTV